ncbi:Polyneuridine-aldehyde esterase precursor, putative [Ricinus communis]|uniref:(S)-hydroxynitrile lyase n=2 Tax=Ricinus communis TaxID=3988 RepID=B9S8M7_RICCO|nr:Polyneuridine-aldehyde esterase precursor, putative [Ricinus communis]
MAGGYNGKHFVFIHGAGGGAWVWYKVKPRLEAVGHRVTVLDMAASGMHPKTFKEVHTFNEYNEPLMKFMAVLQENEKVILVGHSLGGMNLALAMEKYPDKISVAVFATAIVPDTSHQPSYIFEKMYETAPEGAEVDNQVSWEESTDGPITWVHFGPKFLASMIYDLSPIEDLELGKILYRPGSFFLPDLSKAKKLSNESYGSVKKVYILCKNDKIIREEFQRWIIQYSRVQDVVEIKDSDHMPMASQPQEFCKHLIAIGLKYV